MPAQRQNHTENYIENPDSSIDSKIEETLLPEAPKLRPVDFTSRVKISGQNGCGHDFQIDYDWIISMILNNAQVHGHEKRASKLERCRPTKKKTGGRLRCGFDFGTGSIKNNCTFSVQT